MGMAESCPVSGKILAKEHAVEFRGDAMVLKTVEYAEECSDMLEGGQKYLRLMQSIDRGVVSRFERCKVPRLCTRTPTLVTDSGTTPTNAHMQTGDRGTKIA